MILGATSNMSFDYLQKVAGPRVIQIMFVVGFFIYTLFSLIILRQVKVMSQTIDGRYNKGVTTFAWLNLILAVFLFVAAILVL